MAFSGSDGTLRVGINLTGGIMKKFHIYFTLITGLALVQAVSLQCTSWSERANEAAYKLLESKMFCVLFLGYFGAIALDIITKKNQRNGSWLMVAAVAYNAFNFLALRKQIAERRRAEATLRANRIRAMQYPEPEPQPALQPTPPRSGFLEIQKMDRLLRTIRTRSSIPVT